MVFEKKSKLENAKLYLADKDINITYLENEFKLELKDYKIIFSNQRLLNIFFI